MEIIDKLEKPYTEKQRCDFIVKNNHQFGYEIQETDEALLAVYYEPLPPTEEEQKEKRALAYQQEVDPITSHIQRLRDKEQTEEIITKINELIAERDIKVQEIVDKYPYPVSVEEIVGEVE